MLWSDFIQRIITLFLTGPGIGGNFVMFVEYVHMFVMGHKRKKLDLVLMHLAFANAMTLCTNGISDVISVFHLSNFLGNVGCKTVVYLGRVARGLSICTTCLLSVVQAITISPKTSTWAKFKPWTVQQVLLCLLLFWIINTLISSNLLYYITSANNMSRSGTKQYIGYCYLLPSKQIVRWLFLTFMAVRDIIFQSLMGWSSGHVAVYLYKHHKRVLYLRRSMFTIKNKTSPEIRAIQNVLILMTCFFVFYWADLIVSFSIGFFLTNELTILNIKMFITLGYASLSPFLLISRDVHRVHCWPAPEK